MKFKSKKPRPETGMEMSVTLSMPAGQSVDECKDSIIKFFEVVMSASKELGSVWLHVNCRGIPEELEPALQAALEQNNPRKNITLIVDNTVKP